MISVGHLIPWRQEQVGGSNTKQRSGCVFVCTLDVIMCACLYVMISLRAAVAAVWSRFVPWSRLTNFFTFVMAQSMDAQSRAQRSAFIACVFPRARIYIIHFILISYLIPLIVLFINSLFELNIKFHLNLHIN